MKILITLLLMISVSYAQQITDYNHKVICYIQKNGLVETKSHKVLGYINDSTIETPNHKVVGYIDGPVIEDRKHNTVGLVRKSSVQGTYYTSIGYIKGNAILDDEHEVIGYFDNVDPKVAAIFFFFFK